jgi:hypothetical protein
LTQDPPQLKDQLRDILQSMNEQLPKLPPKAAEAFKRFSRRANKGLLHSNDWQMLYRFVYVCRATRVTLSEDDFYRLLANEGFANAEQISIILGHLSSFARMK